MYSVYEAVPAELFQFDGYDIGSYHASVGML